jgi:hypothetical protein
VLLGIVVVERATCLNGACAPLERYSHSRIQHSSRLAEKHGAVSGKAECGLDVRVNADSIIWTRVRSKGCHVDRVERRTTKLVERQGEWARHSCADEICMFDATRAVLTACKPTALHYSRKVAEPHPSSRAKFAWVLVSAFAENCRWRPRSWCRPRSYGLLSA